MNELNIDKSVWIEEVCENCPATCWGQKSICNVHNLHVGKIESCPEWEKFRSSPSQPVKQLSENQIEMTDWERLPDLLLRTEEELKDYSFHLREIERIKASLEEIGAGIVGAYGLEASLPKGKGKTSDKTHREVAKRERNQKRLLKLEESVQRVEKAMDMITNERERVVLECMMDGMRMNVIAKHIGISRSYFHEVKRAIIKKMALAMYGEDQLQAG